MPVAADIRRGDYRVRQPTRRLVRLKAGRRVKPVGAKIAPAQTPRPNFERRVWSNKATGLTHKLCTLAKLPTPSDPSRAESRRSLRARIANIGPWLRTGRYVIALSFAYSLAQALSLPPIFLWPFTFVAVGCLVSAGILAPQFPRRRETGASVLVWSAMGVLPGWIFQQGWIANVTFLGGILLVIALSFATGAIPASIAILHHPRARTRSVAVWIVAAMSFFLWEMLRSHVLIGGYCWALIAQPLIDARPLSAAGSVVGESGVSFLAIAIASCGATILVTRQRKKTAIAGVCIAVLWGLLSLAGFNRPESIERRIRVSILQTNVPQSNKTYAKPIDELEQWQRFEKLIADAASQQQKPDFILWPETMLPGPTLEPKALIKLYDEQIYFNLPTDANLDATTDTMVSSSPSERRIWATAYADRLLEVSKAINIPMLVGADCIEGIRFEKVGDGIRMKFDRRYNSVYLVDQGYIRRDGSTQDPDRPVVRYDKVYLTPFGEQIPFIWRFHGFSEWFTALVARGMVLDLSSGAGTPNAHTVFDIPDPKDQSKTLARVVTPICFESTIADHHRRLIFNPDGSRRADLIASVTNDGWFGGSDMQRHQHLQIVRWRAVETATPVVRAANTGISAVVDARGLIVASGVDGQEQAQRLEGVLTREVPLGHKSTLYATLGQWPAWILTVAGAVLSLVGLFSRRTKAD